ncbi:MAG: LptF/LptG family permease [Vulcanimicrobiota bacterium]
MSLLVRLFERYLLTELFKPTLYGLGLFGLLFYSAELLTGGGRHLLDNAQTTSVLGHYLLLRLPQIFVLIAPMACLLGTILGYSRLKRDQELAALEVGGIPFLRIALPGLVVGILLALLSLGLSEYAVPTSARKSNDLLTGAAGMASYVKAISAGPYVTKNREERVVTAYGVDTEKMEIHGLFVHIFWQGKRLREIYAERVRWHDGAWYLKEYSELTYDQSGVLLDQMVLGESWTRLPILEGLASPQELARRRLRPQEMSHGELRALIRTMPAGIEKKKLELEAHQKTSIPMACIVFALLGTALGSVSASSEASMGLGKALLLLFAYYFVMTLSVLALDRSLLPPLAIAWLPNVLFLAVGWWRLGR